MNNLLRKYTEESIVPLNRNSEPGLSVRLFPIFLDDDSIKHLEELKEESICDPNFFKQWYHTDYIIKYAYKAFNPIDEWFVYVNKYLDKRQYEYLSDTIRYINGDRRRYSLFTWNDLLYAEGLEKIKPPIKSSKELLVSPTNDTKEFIVRWCSQEQGISDLLYSMNLLFGNVVSDIPHNTVHLTNYPSVRIL